MNLHVFTLPTPIGDLALALHDGALAAAVFADIVTDFDGALLRRFPGATLRRDAAPVDIAGRFEAYWGGDAGALDGIPVDLGGTPFQAKVWAALRRIPAGTAIGYAELARSIGAPGSSRAVGAANGANPVWIVVPCHRVIRSDGSLCGYGGGVPRKQWLLAHEGWRALGKDRGAGIGSGEARASSL